MLHWLQASQRIEYKLSVLVYRCLHGLAPRTSPRVYFVWLTLTLDDACGRLHVDTHRSYVTRLAAYYVSAARTRNQRVAGFLWPGGPVDKSFRTATKRRVCSRDEREYLF